MESGVTSGKDNRHGSCNTCFVRGDLRFFPIFKLLGGSLWHKTEFYKSDLASGGALKITRCGIT